MASSPLALPECVVTILGALGAADAGRADGVCRGWRAVRDRVENERRLHDHRACCRSAEGFQKHNANFGDIGVSRDSARMMHELPRSGGRVWEYWQFGDEDDGANYIVLRVDCDRTELPSTYFIRFSCWVEFRDDDFSSSMRDGDFGIFMEESGFAFSGMDRRYTYYNQFLDGIRPRQWHFISAVSTPVCRGKWSHGSTVAGMNFEQNDMYPYQPMAVRIASPRLEVFDFKDVGPSGPAELSEPPAAWGTPCPPQLPWDGSYEGWWHGERPSYWNSEPVDGDD